MMISNMKRSICASGSGYVPSSSIGFCVANTKNGSDNGYVCPCTVTRCSCIASSSAAWVLGGVRLISSASTMFAKTGPRVNLKKRRPVAWSSSSTSVPRMSVGIRSGVNWIRRKERRTASARVRISSVLASPGTPSSSACPPARKTVSSSSTVAAWPTMTLPISARSASSRPRRAATSGSVAGTALIGWGRARSCRHRVDHDVHPELRVVFRQEALVAEVVVPLASVVLVAVQDRHAAVHLDRAKVVVHQIVAPAVQLEGGGGRAVGEGEEGAVERMVVGEPPERRGPEDGGQLRLEGAGEEAVQVVVAVIGEDEPAAPHEALEDVALARGELDQAVAGQVGERRVEDRL